MESNEVQNELQELIASGRLFFVMLVKHGCHPCTIAEPEVKEYLRILQVPFFSFDMNDEIGADLSERFKLKSAPSIIGFVNSKYVTAVGGKRIAEVIEALIE